MTKVFRVFIFLAVWLTTKVSLAAVPAELITEMTETFPGTKQSGEYVELVPDTLWAWMSKPGDAERFSPIPIVKYQGQYYYNNQRSSKRWTNLKSSQEIGEPEQFIQENIFVWMRDHAPIIEIGKVNESTPIVYSAIECPACYALEERFAKVRKAYRVLPSSLKNEPSLEYRSILCAENKSKSWVQAITKRQIDKPASSECKDPFAMVRMWGHIWNVNSYPTASAPANSQVVGIPKILELFSIK